MPIYVQLVTLFHRRIKSGEWPVGQQVPTLDDLTAEFGVARATIRYAIGFLEREGLIGRYRGRGTFVLKQPDIEIWHEIPTTSSTSSRTSSMSGSTADAPTRRRSRRIRAGGWPPNTSSCTACTGATVFLT